MADNFTVKDASNNTLTFNSTVINATSVHTPHVHVDSLPTVSNATISGVVSVDDGASSLTVDGTVAVSAVTVICAGTATIGSIASIGVICAGTALIGSVTVSNATIASGAITTAAGSVITTICAGSALIGSVTVSNATVSSVTVICAGAALIGFVTPTPSATGGWSKLYSGALSTTIVAVTGNACTFGGYFCYNPNNATTAYVQIFDTAANVTLGTTTPDLVFGIPPASAGNMEITAGVHMANGIKLAAATTATGNAGLGTGVEFNTFYK